jgi:hypothetical protein
MQFTDAAVVAGARRRDDGSLIADVRIARTGIQTYLGSEVGRPDMSVVRVYRPGSEVFSADTLKSAAHRPVTNDHPAEMVDSTNWKQHAVGQTGDEVTGEGIYIRVPLMVSDEAAIRDIEGGKREVSAGYRCELDWTPGTTPTGEAFDATQKNIRLNHVAIVARGRAGSEVRIGDAAAPWGVSPVSTADERTEHMPDTLQTVVLGDQAAQVAVADAPKIEAFKAASAKALSDAQAAHTAAIAAKDAELAKKDAEIDALKASQLSDADLDKRVQARADLIAVAGRIAKDVKTAGLSDAAIRRAVVEAKVGAGVIKDKAEAYIDARFDMLAEAATKDAKGADPYRDTLKDGLQPANDAAAAHKAMTDHLQSAWQREPAKGAA